MPRAPKGPESRRDRWGDPPRSDATLPTDPQDPQRDLVETLHGAAMYSDRGHAWLGHDAEQIAACSTGSRRN